MAGFGKFTIISEHYTNTIVNVLWYRSTEWLPLQGNPFDDVQSLMDAVWSKIGTAYRAVLNADTRVLRMEGVGYSDALVPVTSSPLIKTIDATGANGNLLTTGSFVCATLGLRCGEQVQISGVGQSKRNRGYLSLGPITEAQVDNYGHIDNGLSATIEALAQLLDDGITVISPAVTLTPIRIHRRKLGPITVFQTYSDVRGYTLPRKASVRRSRMGEA